MAGTVHSNEDMQSGRVNHCEDFTAIWTQRLEGEEEPGEDKNFKGNAMFIVEVSPFQPEGQDFPFNDWTPKKPIDGIVGSGWSGARSAVVPTNIGGVGVIGNGGTNQGTGVLGRGGGEGIGGIGVHGIGGSLPVGFRDHREPPGIGVLGQGGRQSDNDNNFRLPHGAGIVGLAGGSKKPVPPLEETGSVGVYGQGAEAEMRTVPDGTGTGQNIDVGPMAPGPGVLGRGGVPIPRDRNKVAAGVIGLAGDTPIPPISKTGDIGVYGQGPTGVSGEGTNYGVKGKGTTGVFADGSSTGVYGYCANHIGVQAETESGLGVFGLASDTGRGGAFQSRQSAQLWLVPQRRRTDRELPRLPKDGRCGDIICTLGEDDKCSLWFCVQGEVEGVTPARWARFQLGTPIDGQV